ncbi:MAG TPA: secretin N-terminal domain-containing protein [Planctomycetota bacterium]|nr:secretin N-terminal domain-containing protein [Planctomycetota bacterium]
MIGVRLSLAVFAASALTAAPARAQQEPPPAPPAGGAGAQEMDPRAKAIREAYEERLRRERQQVTIRVRNATVGQIVEEFRRQTGWNIVVDYRNIPDDYRVDEFIVENEPARRALEAFAAKAELSIEDVSPTLIMLSRPPRLTFNFRDADVKVVIDMIARVSGANIIVAPDVKGSITLSINNVPWQEVLNSVVKTLGFVTVRENFGIIRIIHQDELLKQMETRVFRLRYIQPPPTYTAKVEEGKLISGRPIQPPQQIEEVLRRFVLKQTLETVLSRNAAGQVLGKLDFDPQTNSFIVRDTKVTLDKIGEIISLLDVEPEQVLLDVKFVSTTNEDLLTFGVNWDLGGQGGATVSSRILPPSTVVDPVTSQVLSGKITKLPFGFGNELHAPGEQFFLTQYDMTMTLRAFKQDRFSRLLQEPTLAVADNTEATIFVGETISYAEVRTTTNQFGGLEFSLGEAQKSPVKVGFQLFVIPKIVADSNKVILTIIPQNDFLSGQSGVAAVPGFERFTLVSNGAPQSIDLPRISTTTLVTKLVLESGRTAILGGLVVERSTFEDRGIPILKDIPLVNYLFKQRNDTIRKEHLLIFITPRIVRSGQGPSQDLQRQLRLREEQERQELEELRKKQQEQEKKAPK